MSKINNILYNIRDVLFGSILYFCILCIVILLPIIVICAIINYFIIKIDDNIIINIYEYGLSILAVISLLKIINDKWYDIKHLD